MVAPENKWENCKKKINLNPFFFIHHAKTMQTSVIENVLLLPAASFAASVKFHRKSLWFKILTP